jgi:hypothetical protein
MLSEAVLKELIEGLDIEEPITDIIEHSGVAEIHLLDGEVLEVQIGV